MRTFIMARVAKKTRLSVNLSDREYAELTAISEDKDISMSWLARQAIVDFLSRYQESELQLPLQLKLRDRKHAG